MCTVVSFTSPRIPPSLLPPPPINQNWNILLDFIAPEWIRLIAFAFYGAAVGGAKETIART